MKADFSESCSPATPKKSPVSTVKWFGNLRLPTLSWLALRARPPSGCACQPQGASSLNTSFVLWIRMSVWEPLPWSDEAANSSPAIRNRR